MSDSQNGDLKGSEQAPSDPALEQQVPVKKPATEPQFVVRTSTTPRTKPGEQNLAGLRRLSPHAKPIKLKRDLRIGRAGAFLLAALIAIVIPWFVVSKLAGTHHRKPVVKPTLTSAPAIGTSPPSVPSNSNTHSTQTSDAGLYQLVGSVSCVHIRAEPSIKASQISCLAPGTQMVSDGQYKEADGYAWLHVTDSNSHASGWVATIYVKLIRRSS